MRTGRNGADLTYVMLSTSVRQVLHRSAERAHKLALDLVPHVPLVTIPDATSFA